MARRHGKHALVYIGAALVGKLTQWSLNQDTDFVEVTAFGDTNKTYVCGLPDISGSFSGFWDDVDAGIFTAAESSRGGTPSAMVIYPDGTNDAGYYWYGSAYINASIQGGVNGAVEISGSFKASNSWTRIAG